MRDFRSERIDAELVLVGGGHAHVQVLRRWLMRPVPGVRLVLVVDRCEALYSGMVPGLVAGEYAAHELEIDVLPLARRAGARVIVARALAVEPELRCIALEGRAPIRYDVASLDVGSSVRGLELPGVAEYAVATRPIRRFVDEIDARLAVPPERLPRRIAVVGAGAAGVELALTLSARLVRLGRAAQVTLIGEGDEPWSGATAGARAAARRELAQRGIAWRGGERARAVTAQGLLLESGPLESDLVVWATGAAPQARPELAVLPLDRRGFVRVRSTLQVVGHDELFAVGDCASLEEAPWVPRAGVYAVRQGPVLDRNLRAWLRGAPLRAYRPQRDFLALLNTGERRAIAAKRGLAGTGRLAWRWKAWIDRRFMRRFQVLGPEGEPQARFASTEMDAVEEMPCGGCAAKLAAPELERALARLAPAPPDPSVRSGLAEAEDAAALTIGGATVVTSVDAFPAFSDDPFLVGRVAAVNAVSDLHARGARARHALAWVTLPEADAVRGEEVLFQVLAGARAAFDPLGVSLVGGHTALGSVLQVGFSVTGEPGDERGGQLLSLRGLRPGDQLLLTKRLGTGVILAADMRGRAPGRWVSEAWAGLVRDNASAARTALAMGATACTDVSGFGLVGHLLDLLRASGCAARVEIGEVPTLPGALPLLARGLRSHFHPQNRRLVGEVAGASSPEDVPAVELLFDPQTAGGLLMGVAAGRAQAALEALRATGAAPHSARIGEVTEARAGEPRIVLDRRSSSTETSRVMAR